MTEPAAVVVCGEAITIRRAGPADVAGDQFGVLQPGGARLTGWWDAARQVTGRRSSAATCSTVRVRLAAHVEERLVTIVRSLALFVVAAVAEIGGAYLVWQGLRGGRGWPWVGLGGLALTAYGIVATFQPEADFGRVFAAYGGIFIVGSILWGMVFEGFRPDRFDVVGGVICLVGMAVIMYAPRP